MWHHENSNLWNYGIGYISIFRKRKIKKGPSPKISLLVQIGEEIWAPVCSDDSAQILLKLAQIITLTMETSEHNVAYISSPICTNRLIFGKGAFLILFFLDMPTNPLLNLVPIVFCRQWHPFFLGKRRPNTDSLVWWGQWLFWELGINPRRGLACKFGWAVEQ